MKKSLSSLLILICLTAAAFADGHTHSAIVVSTTPLPPITVPDKRTMRIVNFVQEAGAGTASVSVTKDGVSATVLYASDAATRMSAEDKNMQINGLATVTVTNPDATHKAFITYRIVSE